MQQKQTHSPERDTSIRFERNKDLNQENWNDEAASLDGKHDGEISAGTGQYGSASGDAQNFAQDAGREVSEVAGRVRDGAKDAVEQIKQKARNTGEQLKRSASQLVQDARQQGLEVFTRQKQFATTQISHVGDAIDEAASKLSDNGDDTLAGYVSSAADGLRQVAGYFNERDFSQLVNEARQYARQQPALVYGGIFLAGLAAARFLRSSRQGQEATAEATTAKETSAAQWEKQDGLPSPLSSTPRREFGNNVEAAPTGSLGAISNPNMFDERSEHARPSAGL